MEGLIFGILWYCVKEAYCDDDALQCPHNNLLPVGKIAQLVDHCTGLTEVRIQIPFQAFLPAA